jgi:hypothetical protein
VNCREESHQLSAISFQPSAFSFVFWLRADR